jgi:TolB-like protein
VLFLLALGIPLAIFFACAYEMTPEGVKKEKDVDRSQSITHETGRKLNLLITALLVVAVGLLLVDKFVLRDEITPVVAVANGISTADKSVAVLPFIAMSSGPDDEYFADGLTEEILNSLAQLPELLVTARTSAFSFKGMDLPIPEVAAKLGVAHVVEGSVRRAGERLRITAQLIRANDGFHLWSETYDRSGADSFGVQGEIAEKVAAALDIVLDEQELAKMRSSGFRKPEAFIAYQKGIELYDGAHGTASVEEQMAKLLAANQYFERIMELEPGFSGAYYHHADYFIHLVANGSEDGSISEAAVSEALSTASRELQVAARTARTEGERLNVTLEDAMVSSQWRRLPELVADAIRSPDCISPGWWGGSLIEFSSSDGLLALWQRSQECDPLNFYNWSNVAAAQISRGEYRAAVATATRGLEIVPHRQIASELIAAHMALGEFDLALAASQRYFDDVDRRDAVRLLLAAARGDAAEAQRLVDERVAKLGAGRITITMLAITGDHEHANRLAAIQDGRALGYLNLINDLGGCNCGAPFDLEVAPNFARFLEEAKLDWPPPSPINWPLKDW